MAKRDLTALKALFSAQDQNKNRDRGPSNYFNFWDMPDGSQCVIRFLPDSNEENPMGFVVEKKMHNVEVNGKRRSVPCNTMYSSDCPVCAVSAAYYKQDDKVNGKKYWRKASYVAQAMIVESAVPIKDGEESVIGKVKLVSIGYSLWKIIKEAFEGGDLDDVPFAYEGGCDFIIKKDRQGEYASYVLSRFARKNRALTDDEVAYAESEMKDLSTILPPQMDIDKIEAMLEADLSGTPYEEEDNTATAQAPAAQASVAPAPIAEAAAPVAEAQAPVAAAAVAPVVTAPVVEAPAPAAAVVDNVDTSAQAKADQVIAEIKRRKAAQQA
jgi:hypothetical protein